MNTTKDVSDSLSEDLQGRRQHTDSDNMRSMTSRVLIFATQVLPDFCTREYLSFLCFCMLCLCVRVLVSFWVLKR